MDQDQALQSMIENLREKTGKTLGEWIGIIKKQNLQKHGQIVSYLKSEHDFTHGYANLVAHKTLKSDAGSSDSSEDLIENQYKGKEHFRPLFDSILQEVQKFGKDVEIAPKKASVSLRRKKQFALLTPATKSRFELGINLKGQPADGVLEENKASNAMCSHKINLKKDAKTDPELIGWLRKAYEAAG